MTNDNVIPMQKRDECLSALRQDIWNLIWKAEEDGLSFEEIVGTFDLAMAVHKHNVLFGGEEADD